jgi:hypothetical protein
MGLLMSTPKLPSMPKRGAKPAAKPAARKPRTKRSRRPRGKKGGARKRKSPYEEDGEGYEEEDYEEDGEGYEEDGEGYEEDGEGYEEDAEPYASWSPSVNPGKYNALKIKGKAEKYESRHQPYEAAEFASAATPMNFTLLLMVLLFILLVAARS